MTLDQLLAGTAARLPDALAIDAADRVLTYRELDQEANRLAHALKRLGVGPGDRVGFWVDKGAFGAAMMQATLRLGAAYVPLDPHSPLARVRGIVRDCALKAVAVNEARAAELRAAGETVPLLEGWPSQEADASPLPPSDRRPDDLAYILYTSGSTGAPKGVCISHRNARAFIDWAVDNAQVKQGDRLGNHAPFHFDLSVFDLYAAFSVGASVHVVPEALAYAPRQLVRFIESKGLTVWYSVPSALVLMMTQGGLLEVAPRLRTIIFAGEPFPVQHLRTLRGGFPGARLLNWYGPTETNVCTWFEVSTIDDGQSPVPIGVAACGDTVELDTGPESAAFAPEGVTGAGELVVTGPTVMLGYWGQPPQQGPYRTGDICTRRPDGNFVYVGRRDNMVKVRGRRIELGEVEAALMGHPEVQDVAVVAVGEGHEGQLVAFVVPKPGKDPSLMSLKAACAERVPRYMIVDVVHMLEALPRTRNGKTDRLALKARARSPR
ncbi:MAG: amino acid adenylation domain-containing protein [Myxococcaceae bacterium]|nr:amino acid adenylation domain-containing protein [Myxococcaceae bacterium]